MPTPTRYKPAGPGREMATFNSLSELMDAADGTPRDENRAEYDRERGGIGEFTNHYNLERVKSELYQPPPAAQEVRRMAEEITAGMHTQPRRKILRRQEQGDELDALAWINRDPNGWTRTTRTHAPRPVIRMAVNVTVDCKKTPAQLHCRGAAACAMADALESASHRVEITFFMVSKWLYDKASPYTKTGRRRKRRPTGPDTLSIMQCTVKHAHHPLDLDTVALALGEIGFFRTVGFCASLALANAKVADSLGSVAPLPPDMASQFDIILDSNITTPAAAREIVEKHTRKETAAA